MTYSNSHLVLIPSYNPGSKALETVRAARAQWEPLRFRLWVARWNERALRAYRRAGFREVTKGDSRFVEMERPA